MNINSFQNQSAEDFLLNLPDDSIDLTVTSPPYDSLRDYSGYDIDLDIIIRELLRTTKKGGMVVWVVNDQTINGSESLTSFKHAIKFVEAGWNLHDTMIYRKVNPQPNAKTRYQQCFEYMFAFSKGKPKTINLILRERRCKDKRTFRKDKAFVRQKSGEFTRGYYEIKVNDLVPLDNIFEYVVGGGNSTNDKIAFKHPAIFPEKLVTDQILTWTNEGDVVCDIFAGSGTTFKMAKLNSRNYIGCEVSKDYCDIIDERLSKF